MPDGDLLHARVGIRRNALIEDRRHRLIHALQNPALDGDAHKGRHDGLGGGLDVRRPIQPRAAERLLRQDSSVMGNDERAEVGQAPGAFDRLLNQPSVGNGRGRGGRLGCRADAAGDQEQERQSGFWEEAREEMHRPFGYLGAARQNLNRPCVPWPPPATRSCEPQMVW
jgi:hypothetical protein